MKKDLSPQEKQMRERLFKKREEKKVRRLRIRNPEEIQHFAMNQEEIRKTSETKIRLIFPNRG